MTDIDDALVVVLTTRDQREATLARARLEAAGILATAQGLEHASLLAGPWNSIDVRILVPAADRERALQVMAAAQEDPSVLESLCTVHERAKTASCAKCGVALCDACVVSGTPPACDSCTSSRPPDGLPTPVRVLIALLLASVIAGAVLRRHSRVVPQLPPVVSESDDRRPPLPVPPPAQSTAVAAGGFPCFDAYYDDNTQGTNSIFRNEHLQGGGPTWAALLQVFVRRHGDGIRALTEPPRGAPPYGASWSISFAGRMTWFLLDEEGEGARFCAGDPALLAAVRDDYGMANHDGAVLQQALLQARRHDIE
jgi:hypothetical protein